MIGLIGGSTGGQQTDALALFARRLDLRGHAVAIDDATLPEDLVRSRRHALARYLADLTEAPLTRLIVLGAEEIAPETAGRLRKLCQLHHGVPVTAAGHFDDRGALLSSQGIIAATTGHEPAMVDLARLHVRPLLNRLPCPMGGIPLDNPKPGGKPLVLLSIKGASFESDSDFGQIEALSHAGVFSLRVITDHAGRNLLLNSRLAGLDALTPSDAAPDALAARADVLVVMEASGPDLRILQAALDMMVSGRAVVDATEKGALVERGVPALRGPVGLHALLAYLTGTVLPNLAEIRHRRGESPRIALHDFARVEAALDLPARADPRTAPRGDGIVFLPTNGIGIGHAQRCTLIAGALAEPSKSRFAAFPSCVGLIRSRGFAVRPLVQKADDPDRSGDNDLITYQRLRRWTRRGEVLVFDGGYVFDGIRRAILEQDLRAVWIRRGLWQPQQATAHALGRESVFDRVIVPQEAFDELNDALTHGAHVHTLGPIVRDVDPALPAPAAVRARLSRTFDHPADELVITMLGGGRAADRSAQVTALSALLDRRPGCLHLVVLWPGATVHPAWTGWRNTRIVRSTDALPLARAADLLVTAAGYNTFHEVLYHKLPALFVPQVAPMMDDQGRRAAAAVERGVARAVGPEDILSLSRAVTECLDGGSADLRGGLAALSLPERGTRHAATLIEELRAR